MVRADEGRRQDVPRETWALLRSDIRQASRLAPFALLATEKCSSHTDRDFRHGRRGGAALIWARWKTKKDGEGGKDK